MKCTLCPRVAWYTVGSRGYCGDHKAEAYAAAKRESRNKSMESDAISEDVRMEYLRERIARAI